MLSSVSLSHEMNRCLIAIYPYVLLLRVCNRFRLEDEWFEPGSSSSEERKQLAKLLEIAETRSTVLAIQELRALLSNKYANDFESGVMLDLIAHSSYDDFVSYNGLSILDSILRGFRNFVGSNTSPRLFHELVRTERELTAPQFALGRLHRRNRQTREECLFELACCTVEIPEWLRDRVLRELDERIKDNSEPESIRKWATRARENLL